MDQRVMDDEVLAPRQGGGQGGVGGKAGGEIKRRLAAEKGGGLFFQRLMLGMVAAQQARAARARRHPPGQRRRSRLPQHRRFRKRQVIVGSEIGPPARGQDAQPSARAQRLKHIHMRAGRHRRHHKHGRQAGKLAFGGPPPAESLGHGKE